MVFKIVILKSKINRVLNDKRNIVKFTKQIEHIFTEHKKNR